MTDRNRITAVLEDRAEAEMAQADDRVVDWLHDIAQGDYSDVVVDFSRLIALCLRPDPDTWDRSELVGKLLHDYQQWRAATVSASEEEAITDELDQEDSERAEQQHEEAREAARAA